MDQTTSKMVTIEAFWAENRVLRLIALG